MPLVSWRSGGLCPRCEVHPALIGETTVALKFPPCEAACVRWVRAFGPRMLPNPRDSLWLSYFVFTQSAHGAALWATQGRGHSLTHSTASSSRTTSINKIILLFIFLQISSNKVNSNASPQLQHSHTCRTDTINHLYNSGMRRLLAKQCWTSALFRPSSWASPCTPQGVHQSRAIRQR